MDLTNHQLRAVLKIAEKGNISHAASALDLSQPGLSRLLNQVEQNLDARLFDRSGRGVQLTEVGKIFCEHSREILSRHESIRGNIQDLGDQLAGSVRIVMPHTAGVVLFIPLMNHFREHHPNVALKIMPAFNLHIPQYLNSGTADIGLISYPHGLSGLSASPLMTEALYFIGDCAEIPRSKQRITLAEAVRHPLLLPSVSHSYRFYIDNALAEHNLRIDSLLEIDSEDATIQMLKEGQGFSIIPYSMAQREVDDGKLSACLVTDPVISRTFFIATASNRPQTRLVRSVTDELVSVVEQNLDRGRWTLVADS
jgi:LysR family transcriptional regulator, nitrogen assimilation regulatory protein